jgi:hypothetical protein
VPGPDMLHKNLDITYAMVWSIALANILGAGLCYAFSPQFAKLATLRYTLVLPAVLGIVYIGAFEATRQWGDLYALLLFGVLGWVMKQFKWPRPPLVLGLVLGDTIERYLFISLERYGPDLFLPWRWFAGNNALSLYVAPWNWCSADAQILHPIMKVILILAFVGLLRPFIADMKRQGGIARMLTSFQGPTYHSPQLFTMFFIVVMSALMFAALPWDFSAKIVPLVVGGIGVFVAAVSLFNDMCRKPTAAAGESLGDKAQHMVGEKIHMDLTSDTGHLPVHTIMRRAAIFFGYLLAFMAAMAVIGLIPTVAVFVIVFMRLEGRERWSLVIPYAAVLVIGIYVAFDYFMAVPWPPTLIGQWFPALKIIPSVQ